ncbi:MAG: response regulator [Ilumatobacteraceae bacterium]
MTENSKFPARMYQTRPTSLYLLIEPGFEQSEHKRTDVKELSALQRAWLPNAGVAAEPFAPCVVVVGSEDASPTLELMVRMGGANDVHIVPDSRFAASRCVELNPDLVLIDLDTCRVDGHDILASLRRVLPDEEFLPVVVIAGGRTIRAGHRVSDAGAVDLVTKPYDPAELVGRVSNLLRMRGLYRTLKRHNIEKRAGSNAAI